jgi:hypothetical protein
MFIEVTNSSDLEEDKRVLINLKHIAYIYPRESNGENKALIFMKDCSTCSVEESYDVVITALKARNRLV